MAKYIYNLVMLALGSLLSIHPAGAQNPIIQDQFSADPTARVFGDSIYLYPSHDILARPGRGRVGWFCMEDYHVFSSADLVNWKDHGVIVSQYKVNWVDSNAFSMWAPDCLYRNGKYYFYFPTRPKDTTYGRGFAIGVAVADQPYGPFTPEPAPIKNVHGIDPNVFIAQDGQAYLYWAEGNLYGARLKENMLELASAPQVLTDLPAKGLKEGPFLFERNGIYYLTYPHVADKTERLEYATGDNPMGPFEFKGVIMDERSDCWTNHHSIVQFKGQWYLFYHYDDLSPKFDKARSVRIDSLFFNDDGSIKKVIPTYRGVGLTSAFQNIQIDRYSQKSDTGASVAFLDTLDTFKGWKALLDGKEAWVQYDNVDFGTAAVKKMYMRARSSTGGAVQIRLDNGQGPLLTQVRIPKGTEWAVIKTKVSGYQPQVHNLCVLQPGSGHVEIDWVRFE